MPLRNIGRRSESANARPFEREAMLRVLKNEAGNPAIIPPR
jgi:hypothetical protein